MPSDMRAWAVTAPTGRPIAETVRRTRRKSIAACEAHFKTGWRLLQPQGYICARVVVVVVVDEHAV